MSNKRLENFPTARLFLSESVYESGWYLCLCFLYCRSAYFIGFSVICTWYSKLNIAILYLLPCYLLSHLIKQELHCDTDWRMYFYIAYFLIMDYHSQQTGLTAHCGSWNGMSLIGLLVSGTGNFQGNAQKNQRTPGKRLQNNYRRSQVFMIAFFLYDF